jgi:hypothetical protein
MDFTNRREGDALGLAPKPACVRQRFVGKDAEHEPVRRPVRPVRAGISVRLSGAGGALLEPKRVRPQQAGGRRGTAGVRYRPVMRRASCG